MEVSQKVLEHAKREANSLEQQLSSSGGSFAHNRERFLDDQRHVRIEVAATEESTRELCAGLFPFALLPELCRDLKSQLIEESESDQLVAAQKVWESAANEIKDTVSQLEIDGKKLSSSDQSRIIAVIAEVIDRKVSRAARSRLHDLSLTERTKLLAWLERGIPDVARSARRNASSLERLHRQQSSIEIQLRKIPAEDVVRPLMEALKCKYQELAKGQQELTMLQQELDRTRNRLADTQREYDRAADNLSRRATTERRLQVVPKIRGALEEFKSVLILRKVKELESAVTESFNMLCRKKDTMRRISIDSNSFAVTVIDRDGHPIPKSQLSAGEKQVYAISMLWALAKTSRRPLPVIIDTPLARLDKDHRRLLAENYFPYASHQVLMLSTDTEVDEAYFEGISRNVSRSYLLEFSPEECFTSVRSGYFWRNRDEALQVAGD
jgi:DNA sulfur modification protein DndD